MNGATYTAVPSGELAELLDHVRAGVAAEVEALRLPKLAEVVLGGGYGRGEGGVRHTGQGDKLYNDLDFFVFSDRASKRERRAIEAALKPVSERWEKKLGIAVDFSPVKNLSSLGGVGSTLMYQELRRGWKPVLGEARFEKHFPELDAAELPVSEAVRLLLNRGMGLVFAGEELRKTGDPDFVMRNLHKSVLGGGDALLLASGEYRWSGAERVDAFRAYAEKHALPQEFAERYAAAFRYKIEPDPRLPEEPTALWRLCRKLYLDATRRVAGCDAESSPDRVAAGLGRAVKKERSFKNLLRWTLRRGGARPLGAAFDPPVATVAGKLYRLLAENADAPACPAELRRLWTHFN